VLGSAYPTRVVAGTGTRVSAAQLAKCCLSGSTPLSPKHTTGLRSFHAWAFLSHTVALALSKQQFGTMGAKQKFRVFDSTYCIHGCGVVTRWGKEPQWMCQVFSNLWHHPDD
jgi:hypothetical protein